MPSRDYDVSALYFEAHITIEPVFDEELERLRVICEDWGFRVADLLMKRRKQDTPTRSKEDTFCTGRSKSLKDITERTKTVVVALQRAGFQVWRYKIEDTLLDSKIEEIWGLLNVSPE